MLNVNSQLTSPLTEASQHDSSSHSTSMSPADHTRNITIYPLKFSLNRKKEVINNKKNWQLQILLANTNPPSQPFTTKTPSGLSPWLTNLPINLQLPSRKYKQQQYFRTQQIQTRNIKQNIQSIQKKPPTHSSQSPQQKTLNVSMTWCLPHYTIWPRRPCFPRRQNFKSLIPTTRCRDPTSKLLPLPPFRKKNTSDGA